ncbi:DUF4189 domain-containing protein [Xanthomonas campestris pv. campestris]|uniref:DUF4189 domain-containing protein n=1 Tax=Xanthomonas campestris TaxID=339 RepID=UPI002368730B|nr:DUF4189 domain-containing protein [Xanthomonas campestris]WDJ97371.1 DUF4189 domain-containing protein [Xanthomonas campestris pv. incanae]
MRYFFILAFPLLLISGGAWAQGCPVGQYQIGGQGAVACAPIPQGTSIQQDPRPSGKWIKTWGAIAGDGIDNIGVSTGKLKKSDAEQDALRKRLSASNKKCHIVVSYENQCVSAAEPNNGGTMIVANGRSIERTAQNALSDCQKDNPNGLCKIIYQECSEPIFKAY